jgi:hypothetical protein
MGNAERRAERVAKELTTLFEELNTEQCRVIAKAALIIRFNALEEAAKVAETKGVYPELNIEDGGPEWYRHGLAIAADLRALGKK